MDTAPIPPPIQAQASPPKPTFPKTVILFSLLTLILGLALGFGAERLLLKNDLNKIKTLPLGPELLNNKVITYWTGAVEGILIKKDKESFTIKSGNDELTIGIHPNLTQFWLETGPEATSSSKKPPRYTYDQVPLGRRLTGTINIYRKDQNNTIGVGTNAITGNGFSVWEQNK